MSPGGALRARACRRVGLKPAGDRLAREAKQRLVQADAVDFPERTVATPSVPDRLVMDPVWVTRRRNRLRRFRKLCRGEHVAQAVKHTGR